MIAAALALLLLAGGDDYRVNAQPGDWGRMPPEYPGGPSEPCQWQKVNSPGKEFFGTVVAAAITIATMKDSYRGYADYERTATGAALGQEINKRTFGKGRMICITQEQKNLRVAPINPEPIFITK